MGYRVTSAEGSFAYLPDHAPSQGMAPPVRALIEGVDVLLHDAQFTEAERRLADDYGHATVEETVALAGEAGVGLLVLFHHSPVRTDDELDRILDGVHSSVPTVVAKEGMHISVVAAEHDGEARTPHVTPPVVVAPAVGGPGE